MGGLGCDNMTVILVCFLHGRSYDELANKCKKPHHNIHHNSKTEPKIIDKNEGKGSDDNNSDEKSFLQ
eukprot:gene7483-8313_t